MYHNGLYWLIETIDNTQTINNNRLKETTNIDSINVTAATDVYNYIKN